MTTTTFPTPVSGAAATSASSPLVIRDLMKRYGRKLVLGGVDLVIPTGSVTGLLAKNGEGKTTLIKAALGLIRTDGGEVRVLGEPPRELRAEAKARVGYVPQVVALYPWMRPKQLLAYTAAFYPNWNQRLGEQLLRDWRVDPETKVGALSVGTLQKLSIILALAHEPELMILDEPAAALDPQARRDFLKALLEVAADGRRTILFSTHITSDLERVADSVAILRGGRIAYHGALDELKDSVKRLHIVVPENVTPEQLAAAAPGVTRSAVEGGEALLSVRTSAVEQVAEQIEQRLGATVRVEDLSLEDIFLELHHG
jgi:ABC-2 type transport system ATP-binding protein